MTETTTDDQVPAATGGRGSGTRRDGLWRHPDFLTLWIGQTVSLFGSAVTTLALPLTAVTFLHATPGQMGLLSAIGQLPILLFGLPAGAWVDRVRRRPLLIAANLGRALLLGLIPLAASLHALRLELLYVVGFFVGILSLVFNVAYTSFLPSLISREHLMEGNSKLQLSGSAARIAGPNLAGMLVQLVIAPIAIVADALSFLFAAGCIAAIRRAETTPTPHDRRRHLWGEIGDGLRLVLGNPWQRAIAGANGTANLFWGAQLAILILYMTRQVGVDPAAIGLIYACGNVGLVSGTLLAKRVVRRLGLGPALIATAFASAIGALLVPLAPHAHVGAAVLAVAQFLTVGPLIIYQINVTSLQQAITPDHLQGRVHATM